MTDRFLARVSKSGKSKVITIPYLEAEKYAVGQKVVVTLAKPKTVEESPTG